MHQPLLAKVNSRGTVWSSRYIRYNVLAYRMEAINSNSRWYAEVEGIQVQPADDGKGWVVLLWGDEVDRHHRKSDAQRSAETLLDNPRDSYGWPLETCGYYANLGRTR